jgi:hypothetical protein
MFEIRIVLPITAVVRRRFHNVHSSDGVTSDGVVRTRKYGAQGVAHRLQTVERYAVVLGTFPEFEFERDGSKLWVSLEAAGILLVMSD